MADDAVLITSVQNETRIEFPENRLLAGLCGEFDRNLTTIETDLSLQIVRRGNQLLLIGDEDSRARAGSILPALYNRLEQGRSVQTADILAELRMHVTKDMTAEPSGVKQLEMFRGGKIESKTRKKLIEPRTEAQHAYVQALFKNQMAFGIGPAGTGKTYLAVAVGVSMFITGQVDKIILSRPAVEAGERLGFLPGDMKEKVDPYMQPLYDALNDFLPVKQMTKLIDDKDIEIAPLAFMRGRTLANAFVVLDEAQNATSMQMKMFLTRLGEGSRMVITGDRTQIDLPRGVKSGLADAERLLASIPKISFSHFTSKDVVRHPLVAAIVDAYDADTP